MSGLKIGVDEAGRGPVIGSGHKLTKESRNSYEVVVVHEPTHTNPSDSTAATTSNWTPRRLNVHPSLEPKERRFATDVHNHFTGP